MNYNTTPLPRILNARDHVTRNKLVVFHKGKSRYKPNRHIPVCRSGEEHLVENYDLAKNDNFKGWICHHRLELTLDGEFANSSMDLVNKDMYFHRPYFELIWLRLGEHSRLHNSGEKGTMYGKREDKCPNWRGEDVTEHAKRQRKRRAKKKLI